MGSSSLEWLPWTILLSAIGAFATWRAYKNGDRSAIIRRLGWTLLPWGLYFMGLMRFTVRVFDAVADWATTFAFSPLAWLGVGLSFVSVLMIGGGAFLTGRRKRRGGSPEPVDDKARKQVKAKKSAPVDEEADDIEAILRRHGIE
ncbi:hypothetical protein [Solicola gregarius]|uniref:Cellulose synthase n=1 Tax=Solicola gregarius TaxID=2908642 RepID=A0AA46YK20_9ACTN|nr:hypothetical protein [Solicola gregarius]UYM05220.1 hypothetical protein L0C25_22335 [Solicola gregarius]